MKRIVAISSLLFLCACSDDFSTLCYDKPLGYNDVCNTTSKYYDEKMCNEWKQGAVDETGMKFDNNYTVGPIRECLDNVETR